MRNRRMPAFAAAYDREGQTGPELLIFVKFPNFRRHTVTRGKSHPTRGAGACRLSCRTFLEDLAQACGE